MDVEHVAIALLEPGRLSGTELTYSNRVPFTFGRLTMTDGCGLSSYINADHGWSPLEVI